MLRRNKQEKKKKPISRRRQNWLLFLEDVHYNLANSSFNSKVVAFGKLLILLFIMIGVPLIVFLTMRQSLLSAEYWKNLPVKLGNHKILSFIALMLLQAAQIIISVLPGQPIQLTASYLYGLWGGYLICILGAVLGCIITYYLGRFLGNDALHVVFGEERVKDYMHKLNSARAYTIIFLIYLIPGIPKDLVSYVAGVSDISLKPFLLTSTLGRSPALLSSLLIGSFLKQKNYLGIGITVICMLAIMYICWKKKHIIMGKLTSFEDKDEKATAK